MTRRLLGALQFLTVLPIRGETVSAGEAAVFFPLVGTMLGASAGTVLLVCQGGLSRSISALLALVWLLGITGCLHEDGLADVADAVRAGRSREKMMEILKDSRVGTYGAIALMLSVALRWQSMEESVVNPVAGLAAALALSRTSLVALAAFTPPAGTGMGRAFAAAGSHPVLIATAAQSITVVGVAALFVGWRCGVVMIAVSTALVWLARIYFTKRLGGVNGDCLGATCQVVEVANLLILTWGADQR